MAEPFSDADNGRFHSGERAVQRRAGATAAADKLSRVIQPYVAPDFRDYLEAQPVVVVGAADDNGRMWVTMLAGPQGLVTIDDWHTVRIAAQPAADDALSGALRPTRSIGLLFIDFATRTRFRINGEIERASESDLTIRVCEAYANCPKYIQPRRLRPHPRGVAPRGTGVLGVSALSAGQREAIQRADTFFIGTRHADAGADVSHRGGEAGFIAVADEGRSLQIPDYRGNNLFQTLGNLEQDSRTGLLFADFATGSMLQLSGTAQVDWDAQHAGRFPGAQRVLEFRVDWAAELPDSLAISAEA